MTERAVPPGPATGRGEYDAALHLLDRQIVDVDGLLVGKVDDVEIVEDPDGSLVPTALLVGTAALLPRVSAWLYRRWVRLAPQDAARVRPGVVEMGLVDDVGSEVRLSASREGLVRRRADTPPGPVRHTLSDLLAMTVEIAPDRAGDGPRELRVLDVRLAPRPDGSGEHVTALLVGHGRPGSFLGYERSPERGPWLVSSTIRWLHRHSRVVELGPDVEIHWSVCLVRIE
jgi:hypothetical protein